MVQQRGAVGGGFACRSLLLLSSGTPFCFLCRNCAQGSKTTEGCMQKLTSFLAVAVVAAVACSDAFKPTTENVTRDYQLESLTTDSAGVPTDLDAAGAAMEVLLTPLDDLS